MIKIRKKYHFYAGHRNTEAGEKCSRLHGHSYDVVCEFKFNEAEDKESGLTMLFSDIDDSVEPIVKRYDHHFLLYDQDPLVNMFRMANEPFISLPFMTSAENMAMHIYHRIKDEAKLPICRIELSETKSSTIIYEETSS